MTDCENKNALKHGAFSEAVIMPGEDPNELKELRDALYEEWDPEGPIESDLVESIALNMWRKRRFRRWLKKTYVGIESLECFIKPYNEKRAYRLLSILDDIEDGKLTQENLASRANRMSEDYPRSNFANERALLDVITYKVWQALSEDSQMEAERELSAGSYADREQAFEERIDAEIAKDIKQLGQIKTMKAMGLGKQRTPAPAEPLKQIESPPI
jgi:hypothetical protein